MKFRTLFVLVTLFAVTAYPAIKIKQINFGGPEKIFPETFSSRSDVRKRIDLSENWEVYSENDLTNKAVVTVPAVFDPSATLIFKNTFTVTARQLEKFSVVFNFPPLNYYSEISINDQSVIKHANGSIPFKITVPDEILLADEPNTITVKINPKLTSNSTVPPLQRFLFSEHKGGIFGKISLELIPETHVSDVRYKFDLKKKRKKTFAEIEFTVETAGVRNENFSVKVILANDSLRALAVAEAKATEENSKFFADLKINLPRPKLWTPENPVVYYAVVRLFSGNTLIDEIVRPVPLLKVEKKKNGLTLNGKPFELRGVTYVPFSEASNPDYSYERIENDFALAKSLGFNFIRFPDCLPDEKITGIAARLGLFVSAEVPLNFLPESFVDDDIFSKILSGYVKEFADYYSGFYNVLLLGAGSSLLPSSENHIRYVNDFAEAVKKAGGKFSFASFLALPEKEVGVDFVNVEFYSKIKSENLEGGNFLPGEIFVTGTYPAFAGSKSGSLIENSYEAQGKFFKRLITFGEKKNYAGIFIHSLTDYSGDYNSFYSAYSPERIYKIGIVGIDRKVKRIGYNVIRSRFRDNKNIVIPLGSRKIDFPLIFIVTPLFLAALIAFVINSRRKFREDATRALLRSYNFFADIRDLRLLSGFHSYFMFFVNSATFALLAINILYFLRASVGLDKIVTAFGSGRFSDFLAYLAWNPLNAFFALFGIFIAITLAIAFVLKFFSIFNPTRVLFSSIFYTVVWAFMPVNLLIPVELLLLKVLALNVVNVWIYAFLFVYFLWLLGRLFKGVYVVFDIRPVTVYSFGLGLIFLILAAFVIYIQTSVNGLDYLGNAFAQLQYLK